MLTPQPLSNKDVTKSYVEPVVTGSGAFPVPHRVPEGPVQPPRLLLLPFLCDVFNLYHLLG